MTVLGGTVIIGQGHCLGNRTDHARSIGFVTESSGRSLRLFPSPGLSVLQAFMASRWLHTAQPGPAERSDGFLAQGNGVPVASAEGGHGAEGDVTIGFRS